jgi:hypothetical protein
MTVGVHESPAMGESSGVHADSTAKAGRANGGGSERTRGGVRSTRNERRRGGIGARQRGGAEAGEADARRHVGGKYSRTVSYSRA